MRRDWRAMRFSRRTWLKDGEKEWKPEYQELRELVIEFWPLRYKQLGTHSTIRPDGTVNEELVVVGEYIKCSKCKRAAEVLHWAEPFEGSRMGPFCDECLRWGAMPFEHEDGQTDDFPIYTLTVDDKLWPIAADILVHEHPPEEENYDDEVFMLF